MYQIIDIIYNNFNFSALLTTKLETFYDA